MLHVVLTWLALLCFILACVEVPARVNLIAAGLALLTLTLIV